MDLQTTELQRVLYEIKQKAKLLLDKATSNQVKSALQAKIGLMDEILIWLHTIQKEREPNMEKLSLALEDKLVSLEELPTKKRRSEVEDSIIELIDKLKPGKAIPVDHSKISYGNFYGRITKMKKANKIPASVVVRKRGKEIFVGKEQ